MKFRNKILLSFCSEYLRNNELSLANPEKLQRDTFEMLIDGGKDTLFGNEHKFAEFKTMNNLSGSKEALYCSSLKKFQKCVPIRDYNAFYPYIQKLREGQDFITWNQKVKWFAKSSGTSSDKSKYIPITPQSLKMNHYGGFRSMLVSYISQHTNSKLFYGDSLTLGGSVTPDLCGNKYAGDLSAILLKNSPRLAEIFRTPSRQTALISDFTEKINAITKECLAKNVTSFAGVPSWNLMLMNNILKVTGKHNLAEIWPNMELFMHGGIGFEPYRKIYNTLFPQPDMHYIESYNASEGYFGFQDNLNINCMSFTCGNGIFYEFVRLDTLLKAMEEQRDLGKGEDCGYEFYNLPTFTIEEVETNVNYALVISTVGGLWRYLIGDTVMFTSLSPKRFKITGRTKLCINAFGEELMIDNAEKALVNACNKHNVNVIEFTVAPVFMEMNESASKGAHKWIIEFEQEPDCLEDFADTLDKELTYQNSDYEAKRSGDATMTRLQLISAPKGTFYKWMENRGKIGGQNKVPRLSSSNVYVKELLEIVNSQKL